MAASRLIGIAPLGEPLACPTSRSARARRAQRQWRARRLQGTSFLSGLEDLPSEHARAVVGLDLGEGSHLIVAGDPGSGRSTALRTIAGSAASQLSPTEFHLYVQLTAGMVR